MERTIWNPKVELMNSEEVRAFQLEQLKNQLVRVYEQSPYYKEKFDKAKVNPYKFKSFDQYRDYPFFDKEEERLSQERSKKEAGHSLGMHITCDPKKVIRISSSSGTTGKPTFQGYTQKDRQSVSETGARCFWRTGIRPGDVVMHGYVLSMWIAGTPGVDILQNFGATAVPIGATTGVERFAQVAQEVFPRALNCTPSYAEYLIKKLPERAGVEAKDFGFKILCVGGEPGGSIPQVRQRIEEGFGGAKVFDQTGSTNCVSKSSSSCEAQAGMHFLADDFVYSEILDPDSLEVLPFENGVEGELVITGLQKECAPTIRFREKDIVQVITEPCSCGKPGWRFSIKGRADDMLLIRGVNVFPHAIKDVITSFRPEVTGALRVVLEDLPPVVQPPLPIRVEHSSEISDERRDELSLEIEDKVHHILRFRAKVEMVAQGTLEDTHHKTQLIEKQYEKDLGAKLRQ